MMLLRLFCHPKVHTNTHATCSYQHQQCEQQQQAHTLALASALPAAALPGTAVFACLAAAVSAVGC
jgi:hypothetical protein